MYVCIGLESYLDTVPKHGMLNSENVAKLVSLGEIQTIPDWSQDLCLPFPPFWGISPPHFLPSPGRTPQERQHENRGFSHAKPMVLPAKMQTYAITNSHGVSQTKTGDRPPVNMTENEKSPCLARKCSKHGWRIVRCQLRLSRCISAHSRWLIICTACWLYPSSWCGSQCLQFGCVPRIAGCILFYAVVGWWLFHCLDAHPQLHPHSRFNLLWSTFGWKKNIYFSCFDRFPDWF